MPAELTCPDCGTRYDAGPDEPWRCACGRGLEFTERPHPNGDPLPLHSLDTSEGLWTFFEFLPIEQHVTFYEGFTPMVDAPEWDAQFKLEYVFPTGSFKDRGDDDDPLAGGRTRRREGHRGLLRERGCIDRDLRGPRGPRGGHLRSGGRQTVEADGDPAGRAPRSYRIGEREDVTTAACLRAVEGRSNGDAVSAGDSDAPHQTGEGWYASHAWNPAFYAGTMTFAFEVAAQQGWTVPDAVVLPIGHGTLFLGAYRGFSLLNEAGIVDGMPRLLGAQAAGYAPIVAALGGDTTDEDGDGTTIADGIRITEPARGTEILEAIEETTGDVIAIGGDRIETALDRLHRNGFYVEPTCAVAPAALEQYREAGVLDDDADVVVPLTGSGLKTL